MKITKRRVRCALHVNELFMVFIVFAAQQHSTWNKPPPPSPTRAHTKTRFMANGHLPPLFLDQIYLHLNQFSYTQHT